MGKHMTTILWKQIKDTLKNKTILIQFVMFPALTVVMENTIKPEGMPEHFFATLFAVMYIGMAPLTSMAAILAEEKENNTLRVLLLSNVKPMEYLLGVGIYIWCICMLGVAVIGACANYSGKAFLNFWGIAGVGILVSVLLGAVIGTWSKNQMMATSITIPVMMIFSFLPMLAMFNDRIEKIAKITYSQQVHRLLNQVENISFEWEWFGVICGNAMAALLLFILAYRRKGL